MSERECTCWRVQQATPAHCPAHPEKGEIQPLKPDKARQNVIIPQCESEDPLPNEDPLRDVSNEYRPWESEDITELEYFKRRYLELRAESALPDDGGNVVERLETGPIQFGDDWPGTFIRGDQSFAWAMAIELIQEKLDLSERIGLNGLVETLHACNVNLDAGVEPTRLPALTLIHDLRAEREGLLSELRKVEEYHNLNADIADELKAENERLRASLNCSTDTIESGNDVLESLLAERDRLRDGIRAMFKQKYGDHPAEKWEWAAQGREKSLALLLPEHGRYNRMRRALHKSDPSDCDANRPQGGG